jgi:single-strand DNA-binding protein
MNSQKNKINLVGRLGQSPTLKKLTNSIVCNFSVAVDENYKQADGTWTEGQTSWHEITSWGKTAERANAQLKKGSIVSLEGRLVYSDYEKQPGVMVKAAKIEMRDFDEIVFVSKAKP